jgi:uncharacterized protein YdhG (YjbR/CyaY superfamily)
MKTARTPARNIDAYIAGFAPDMRRILERVRRTIRKALPGVEEAVSYGIPALKLHGRTVIYFAGWKQHYSLYPSNARLEAAFKEELAPYEASGKGTIRFPLSERVPVKLIADIARFLAQEAAQREKAKPATRKKRSSS